MTSLDAADVGADAGNRRGHRFDQRDRRAFVARGEREHVGRAVDDVEIAAPAEKAHGDRRCRATAPSPRARRGVRRRRRSERSRAVRPRARAGPASRKSSCCLIAVSRPTVATTSASGGSCSDRAGPSPIRVVDVGERTRDRNRAERPRIARRGRCDTSSSRSRRICGEMAISRSVARASACSVRMNTAVLSGLKYPSSTWP